MPKKIQEWLAAEGPSAILRLLRASLFVGFASFDSNAESWDDLRGWSFGASGSGGWYLGRYESKYNSESNPRIYTHMKGWGLGRGVNGSATGGRSWTWVWPDEPGSGQELTIGGVTFEEVECGPYEF
jgi:hypothetical protein